VRIWDDIDRYDDDQDSEREITCKRCGKSGLTWSEESTGWVLMEGKYKVHRCDMTKAAADDFDVIE
jgi:hypothetical protein